MDRTSSSDPPLRRLDPADFDAVVDVLTAAFAGYPVMQFVLGPEAGEVELRTLVRLFVGNRVYSGDPIFGIETGGRLAAALTTTEPVERSHSPELEKFRRRSWLRLGDAAQARYRQCVRVWQTFEHPQPHFHVNMVGVRPEHRGQGLAKRLLLAAHALADAHPRATGVSLTTEARGNVAFYERLGYRSPGPVDIAGEIETWDLFRPRAAGS